MLSVARTDDGGALTIDCELPPDIDEATANRLRCTILTAADPVALGVRPDARVHLSLFAASDQHLKPLAGVAPTPVPRHA